MQYLVFDANVTQRWRRVKEFVDSCTDANFWVDIKRHTRSLLKDAMELAMLDEMVQYMNARPYQRTDDERLDWRNGYYYRSLDTELGPMTDIKIPRSRLGLFRTKVFERYQRRQAAVNEAICNVFLSGVSTRGVSGALKPLLETTFSASCVSNVTKSLDSKVKEFHRRELLDEYQFLFLDGITLKVKTSLHAIKKLVLVAYGITVFGKKELISFRIASSESQNCWEAFLNGLYTRGLKGDNLKLVITDGCRGLHAALDIVYAYTKRQHCWAHKLRNAAKYLKKSDEKEVLAEAKEIYKSETKREAARIFKRWKTTGIENTPRPSIVLKKIWMNCLTS